jgi:hypothetical protein
LVDLKRRRNGDFYAGSLLDRDFSGTLISAQSLENLLMWIATRYLLNLMLMELAEQTGSGASLGPLFNCYVGLSTAPTPPPTSITHMSDITEANYTAYARQLVVWYPPFIQAAGPYALEGHSLNFQPSDGVTPNVITGVFLADALAGGNYLCGLSLGAVPVPLPDSSRSMIVDAVFSLPFLPVYGGPDVSN